MIEKLFDLRGRVAIRDGRLAGLGAEFAEGLAEAGASLMLCARRDEWLVPGVEALRGRGFTAHAMRCDVSNIEQVQAVIDTTVERFGQIDILVNNAGVSWGERPETMTLANGRRSSTRI
jgi:gluconate 5-dehydrogenase